MIAQRRKKSGSHIKAPEVVVAQVLAELKKVRAPSYEHARNDERRLREARDASTRVGNG